MINVAVLGYGTVGSGIVDVLDTNKEEIVKKVGEEINVSYVLDLREFPNNKINDILVHDYDVILNDDSVRIVAEAMGGVEPAYTFAKQALEKGKHFCTSNKELVAKHGASLIALAKKNNVNFQFEASVGGGIPLIRPLISSLAHEQIEEITGILNGTTNYMLSKMANDGVDFDVVLKDAQEKGYAERNPEADVEGYDACRKIAILSALAFGKNVDFEDIHTEGITNITKEDMDYAKAMGRSIKLLATCVKDNDNVSAYVAPMLVDNESPLYSVNGVFNAVFVKGNTANDLMFYGSGAGKLPTASAVVSDIVEEARNLDKHIAVKWDKENLVMNRFENVKNSFFVRIKDNNKTMNKKIKDLFDDIKEISIDKLDEYAFITSELSEGEFKDKIYKIGNVINYIRIKE